VKPNRGGVLQSPLLYKTEERNKERREEKKKK
jgi:hypothetical protein